MVQSILAFAVLPMHVVCVRVRFYIVMLHRVEICSLFLLLFREMSYAPLCSIIQYFPAPWKHAGFYVVREVLEHTSVNS